MSVVGATDKLLQFGQTVCFRQGEDELRLHVGLSGFLSSHLEEFHQIFPIICKPQMTEDQPAPGDCWSEEGRKPKLTVLAGCIDHLHVSRRVDSFNVRVDGLLDQASVQLSSTQLAPHRRFITALCKLVGSVQVPYVLYQYLQM